MADPMASSVWYLEGVIGDGRTLIISLEPLPFLVGRREGCHLRLSSKNISREHALLFEQEGSLWVRDLASRNGTFLNRELVSREVPLKHGDTLHFGDLQFRICRRQEGDAHEESSETMTALPDVPGLLWAYEVDLKAMMAYGTVESYFQPIVRLSDLEILAYEVTSRGCYGGLPSSPVDLLSLAESLDCASDLSRFFWKHGLQEGRRLPGPPHLFINLHPAELESPGLLGSLAEARETAPDLPITVEISEKAVTDLKRMEGLKERLADLGMLLAYDDFGAGQARFRELIEVPPHFLKFDQSLIRDIHERPKRVHTVVAGLVEMARELEIAPVAEGVESPAEGEACREIGFHYAQGFHYGPPKTAQDLS
jgi:EAL domain-containing protein (putative c-di-GMP-specific phosphodiesterase class I)